MIIPTNQISRSAWVCSFLIHIFICGATHGNIVLDNICQAQKFSEYDF